MTGGFIVRPGQALDFPYVFSSFAREMPDVCGYAGGMSGKVAARLLEPFVTAWRLDIACPVDDQELIVGWILRHAPDRIAWVHTHRNFRKHGIAQALLRQHPMSRVIQCPFRPTRPNLVQAIERQGVELRFRPWLGVELETAWSELAK